jgi:hypothetical protein
VAFQKRWDPDLEDYISDRTLTGPPKAAPETGTTVQDDGVVIVADQNVQPDVPPVTPVTVSFPGPNEPIVGKNGLITPRWWRFLDELYRRTGGVNDNINRAPSYYRWVNSTVALSLAGAAPSVKIDPGPEMSVGSIALTGQTPVRVVA